MATMTVLTDEGQVQTQPSWTCRAAAILILAMASLVIIESTSGPDTPGYVLVLVGTLAAVTLGLFVQMWDRHTFRTAIAADTLALLTMVTQLLVSMVGSPGATHPDPHWSVVSVGVVATAFAVLVMLAADSPYAPTDTEDQSHPYAL